MQLFGYCRCKGTLILPNLQNIRLDFVDPLQNSG